MKRSGLLIGLVSLGLATAEAAEPPPSADFLAFLGEMERIDGEWVDPMSVEELPMPAQDGLALGDAATPATGPEQNAEEGADDE